MAQMMQAPTVYAVPQQTAVVSRPPTETEPADPFRYSIAYTSSLSDNAKFLGCAIGTVANPGFCCPLMTCAPCCNCLCWNRKLKNRAYVSVMENRVEMNYPTTYCFGCAVADCVSVTYFDKFSNSVKAERMCTPFHFCYCIELCGGVVALAPCDAVNCCLCPCCRCYIPGLADSQGFSSALLTARTNFFNGIRSGPASHQTGPGRVVMTQ